MMNDDYEDSNDSIYTLIIIFIAIDNDDDDDDNDDDDKRKSANVTHALISLFFFLSQISETKF